MAELNIAEITAIKFDGFVTIATGRNRKSKKWKNQRVPWSKLLKKFSKPLRTSESQVEFYKMPKDIQDNIKDVGGFVGGELKDDRRVAENVVNRQIITLDADYAPYSLWSEVSLFLNNACCLYSTHKHNKDNPRYRLVIPLDRAVTPDEYQAIGRKIADMININYFDDTTYQSHRLMYYPSASKDAEYIFRYQDGPWLSADSVLAEYENWKDQSTWPVSDRTTRGTLHTVKQQEDPLTKSGIIGAFCRAYTISAAIDNFLPDVYTSCESGARYTYAHGTSSGGAVVYDDKFLYSHHATDPCSMQLCNAFDLVRIHKFGASDTNAKTDETTKLPSYTQMCEFASKDKNTKLEIATEKMQEAGRDFENLAADEPLDLSWTLDLMTHPKTGKYLATRSNIELILKNDPAVKDTFGYELFSQRIAIKKKPVWRSKQENEPYWTDTDEANLRGLLETTYEIDNRSKVDDCIAVVANANRFHVVREYLQTLSWDNQERLETLFIDYLGAEDSLYVREVTRKTLVAAVARVMEPGIKFDTMPVLVGRQGLGKSYLLKKLGGPWFSDSITSLQGKEAFEQLRGVWINEMSELSALRKMEVEAIKQYITKQVDTYRPPYGKCLQDFPRQCVFIGTTNVDNFLRDKTGNRRFLPVRVGVCPPNRNLFAKNVDEYIKQVWAEALHYYVEGESLILGVEAQKAATFAQKEHMEENPLEGSLSAYLDLEVPKNWYELDIKARREFVRGEGFGIDMTGAFVRDKICTAEVWCELLGGDIRNFGNYDRREIRETLNNLLNWERYKLSQGRRNFGNYYGNQTAWVRLKE